MAARFYADPRGRSCADCTPELRALRNCDGKSNPRFREVWGDTIADRCPLAVITPLSRALLRHYLRYRDHGLLPRVGGTGEQSARLMEGMDLLRVMFKA